jgi:hypothetical protein
MQERRPTIPVPAVSFVPPVLDDFDRYSCFPNQPLQFRSIVYIRYAEIMDFTLVRKVLQGAIRF